jgi:CxxC motif-containing protein (DUF1111 family)
VLSLVKAQGRTLSGSFPKNFAKLDPRLTKNEMAHLKVGYSLFAKPWVQAPASTKRRDGLGPHFNAVSCMSCHAGMGRGAPPKVLHENDPSLVLKSNSDDLFNKFGDQITPKSLPGFRPEMNVKVHYEKVTRYGLDLVKPILKDEKGEAIAVGTRISPHLAGLGRLEAIPEEEIIKNSLSGGTVSRYQGRVARFGWKASQEDLRHQVAAAFSKDMGITSSLYPHERCESGCAGYMSGADEEGVEIRDDHLEMVVTLMIGIEPPKPLHNDKEMIVKGQKVFKEISCQSCHRISYDLKEWGTIEPYTDLLLHDMGEGLADNGTLNGDMKKMWRTAPLWGLGSQRLVNGHTRLLHDGRARNVEEAILWHGGEATPSVRKFLKLEEKQKKILLSFLNNL